MNNLKFIALEISKRSYANYHRHGAILVRNGKIVSFGVNDESNHAEVNAVRRLKRVLPNLEEPKGRKVATVSGKM